MSLYASNRSLGGGGSGVNVYTNLAAFPASAPNGTLAVAGDTHIVYEYNTTAVAWQPIASNTAYLDALASAGAATSIGALDAQAENPDGLALVANVLSAQSADATHPGMVNNTTQTFSGQKTFSTGLTGTLTGFASLNVLTSALGNLTDVGTDGISVTGGTGAVVGSVSLSQHVSDTTHNGYLSSTDWNTFNNKQAAGNYLTALTGDVTASGPGSAASTVAKIQGTTVSGTTGSTNVVFSTAPTLSNPIVGTQSQGDTSTKAASTAYVDVAIANAVSGINPAVAVQAATTSASDTSGFTYNNGASGVGATLTGPSSALVVDGYTFTALGQRLLVKNDTQSPSGAFNGVYYVTQIQTGVLPLVLTRALDYNQPSDMNNTGAIPVINGTVNGTTSWVLTSLVTTVGTDPLTFTKFTRNPADYLLVANNLSDVGTKATAFNNVSPVTSTGDLIIGNGSNSNTRLAKGTQYQTLQTGATTLGYDAVHLDQAAAVTGVLPNANTTANATPTASAIAAFDANKNLSANSLLEGYTTTATAAATTTLVVGSTEQQYFTGSTTQTVLLPVTSTLVLGQKFIIVNNSSGVVTVQSSGANTIQAMGANSQLTVTVISTSGTGTSSWNALYQSASSGTVTSVTASGPSGIATWSSAVTTSGTLTQTLSNQNANVVLAGPSSGSATTPTFRSLVPLDTRYSINAQSASYTLLTTDYIVTFDASGAGRTATLPTAVGFSGLTFVIKKIDSSTNLVTINTTSAQTIDGAASGALTLATQYETLIVASDGANWIIVQHKCNTSWTSFTPTGSWSTNTTYTGEKRRVGDQMEYRIHLALSGAPTSATLTVNIPETIDTAKLPGGTIGTQELGQNTMVSAGNRFGGPILYKTTTSVAPVFNASNAQLTDITQVAPSTFGNNDLLDLYIQVPIVNFFA